MYISFRFHFEHVLRYVHFILYVQIKNMFRTCSEIRTFYLTQNWKDMNILSCIDMHILSYIFSISFRAFFEHVLNSAATHPLPCSLSLSLSLSLFLHSKARCSKTYMIVICTCLLYLQLYLYSSPPVCCSVLQCVAVNIHDCH